MKFKTGDRVEVFTSPGLWMPVDVYAVDGEWLEVGNGDPVYHGNEIRESFRVHRSDARAIRPLAIGDVVAVETYNGEGIGYFGEVASLPDPNAERAVIGVYNPDTDCVHRVPSGAEVVRLATAEEAEQYRAVNG